jgi:hypothetical protein
VGTKTDSVVSLTWKSGETLSGRPALGAATTPTSLIDLFTPQFEAFVRAIRGEGQPVASGVEAVRSIELLTECYARRQPWVMPWDARPALDEVLMPEVAGVAR